MIRLKDTVVIRRGVNAHIKCLSWPKVPRGGETAITKEKSYVYPEEWVGGGSGGLSGTDFVGGNHGIAKPVFMEGYGG
jgi:hypothetical protein